MMDVLMAAVLLCCAAAIKLFIDWCDAQITPKKK